MSLVCTRFWTSKTLPSHHPSLDRTCAPCHDADRGGSGVQAAAGLIWEKSKTVVLMQNPLPQLPATMRALTHCPSPAALCAVDALLGLGCQVLSRISAPMSAADGMGPPHSDDGRPWKSRSITRISPQVRGYKKSVFEHLADQAHVQSAAPPRPALPPRRGNKERDPLPHCAMCRLSLPAHRQTHTRTHVRAHA